MTKPLSAVSVLKWMTACHRPREREREMRDGSDSFFSFFHGPAFLLVYTFVFHLMTRAVPADWQLIWEPNAYDLLLRISFCCCNNYTNTMETGNNKHASKLQKEVSGREVKFCSVQRERAQQQIFSLTAPQNDTNRRQKRKKEANT